MAVYGRTGSPHTPGGTDGGSNNPDLLPQVLAEGNETVLAYVKELEKQGQIAGRVLRGIKYSLNTYKGGELTLTKFTVKNANGKYQDKAILTSGNHTLSTFALTYEYDTHEAPVPLNLKS